MATRKQPALKITPPFGYGDIVPLKQTDSVLLPTSGAIPGFCRSINALALSYTEFNIAARDYPIVFASADAGKTYAPVIVLGLADEQNLFVDAAGNWDDTTYLPAFVRRHPFCISRLQVRGKAGSDKVVCVAAAHLDPQQSPAHRRRNGRRPSACCRNTRPTSIRRRRCARSSRIWTCSPPSLSRSCRTTRPV